MENEPVFWIFDDLVVDATCRSKAVGLLPKCRLEYPNHK